MQDNQKTLHKLLYWLVGYVVLLVVISLSSGKISDAIPIVANLVAAFAIRRSSGGTRNGE